MRLHLHLNPLQLRSHPHAVIFKQKLSSVGVSVKMLQLLLSSLLVLLTQEVTDYPSLQAATTSNPLYSSSEHDHAAIFDALIHWQLILQIELVAIRQRSRNCNVVELDQCAPTFALCTWGS